MKKIRCAFVASYYGPYYSNFVASVLALEREMQNRDYSMIYVFPEEVKEFPWIGMLQELTDKIYYLKYDPHSFGNYIGLKKIFRKENVNLIYSHMCGWDFTAHFAAPFTPIIWHMRMNVNVTSAKKKIKNWLKFRIVGFGKTYHIAVSHPVADAINELKPRHRCVAIPNALDFSRLHPEKSHSEMSSPAKILIFGWQPSVKGLDFTLDAAESLNAEKTKIQLLVSAQEKTYQYLSERYDDDLPEWMTVLPPTSNVSDLYNQADIMLSASRSEGFSFALAEAIYSGLPVVYSDIPGTSWAGEFKKTHVFKSGDADDLKRAICECIGDGISEEEIDRNVVTMEDKYSMDIWVKKVMAFIEEICPTLSNEEV